METGKGENEIELRDFVRIQARFAFFRRTYATARNLATKPLGL
jgi:hypothetical protein